MQLDNVTPGLFDDLHILLLRFMTAALGGTLGLIFTGIFGLILGSSTPAVRDSSQTEN